MRSVLALQYDIKGVGVLCTTYSDRSVVMDERLEGLVRSVGTGRDKIASQLQELPRVSVHRCILSQSFDHVLLFGRAGLV